MTKKSKPQPRQEGLFGTSLDCPDMGNLPLIVDPKGEIEVLAPGSIYQPVLLSPDERKLNIQLGPGALDKNEEKFVRDLIKFLYPAGNHPKSENTPLLWQGKEVWLKRNIDKEPGSFRLRVDDSNWFYPDFIVWILDPATRTQTFGFVDPKGLAVGTTQGFGNYKIVSTLYMPHVVEQKMEGLPFIWEGEEWTFRARGVLVSTTAFAGLREQAKFFVRDEKGADGPPDEADFNRARIVFPKDQPAYIQTVLELLTHDNELDGLLKDAARLNHSPSAFSPDSEAGYDLAIRHHALTSEAEWVAALVKDYLKPDSSGKFGTWAQSQARLKLLEYAKTGFLGIREESAVSLRDHPTPCEELWKRILSSKK